MLASHTVQFVAPQKEWWPIGLWEKMQRYYVENAMELLDQPGEWYLNRETGVLSYRPMPGEQMEQVTVIAPRLTELVRLAGNADQKNLVQHITLRGLAFQHGDWGAQTRRQQQHAGGGLKNRRPLWRMERDTARLKTARYRTLAPMRFGSVAAARNAASSGNRICDFGAGGVRIGEAALSPE